jgi:hypothetical protein
VAYAAGPSPGFVAAADFNGDGKLDLAVGNVDVETNPNTVAILMGKGDGTFAPPILHPVAGANSLAVADFNGDGNLDMVAAGTAINGPSTVSVLLESGRQGFAPAVTYNAPGGVQSVAVADFNGDGFPDLAVGESDLTVSILPGNCHASFNRLRPDMRQELTLVHSSKPTSIGMETST